jgi:D-amino-acid dehydrogenase
MKILVLGAGVIGVTTAYYLAKLGFDVEVIDRQPGPGLETSYANAGEISPGYASPWAAPGVPLKATRWLLDRLGPLVVRPQLDHRMWAWMFAILCNCNARRYAINKRRMVAIAEYSRDCLRGLRAETGIAYDHRSLGTLQLFRKQKQLDAIGPDVEVLKQYGVAFELLDRDRCISAEPGLDNARVDFAGGLKLPDDETGDCFLFTQRLANISRQLGVRYTFNTEVLSFVSEAGRISAVRTSNGLTEADTIVVALGSFSPLLVRSIGINLPVYPVKGYSLTLPIVDPDLSPVSTVMDETYKVAITRLGDRIRVGGTAEVGNYTTSLNDKRRRALERSLLDLFASGGDLDRAQFWCGLRPMTPDGPPIVGASSAKNVFINTGHGTLGWTMACGSGRALADTIAGRTPDISLNEFAVSRDFI